MEGERKGRKRWAGKKNGWWWWRWINCWTRQDKRRADTERGGIEREVSRVTGRWTVKRWSGALQHARGQSNKRAAVKNQYLLINFPTLLACKKPVEQCLYWHSSPPSLYRSFQTRGPNRERCDRSGRLDGGQIGGKRAPALAAAAMPAEGRRSWRGVISLGISEGVSAFDVMILSRSSERRQQ